jgi:hypothetical protein
MSKSEDSAFERYKAFDFENDRGWKLYKLNISLPHSNDPEEEAAALEKCKRRYYQRNIDPSIVFPEETRTSSKRDQSSGSRDRNFHPSTNNNTSTSPNSTSSTSSSYSSYTNTNAGTQSQSNPITLKIGLWLGANVFVILCAILFVLPFQASANYYAYALLAAALTCVFPLISHFQNFTWSMEFAVRLMMLDSTQYLLLCLVFSNSYPLLLLLPVLVIYAALNLSTYLPQVLSNNIQARPILFATGWVNERRAQARYLIAYFEVLLMGLVLIKFFQGYLGFVNLFVYWQFLNHRYRTCGEVRQILENVAAKIDGVVYAYMPPFISRIYAQVRSFLYRFAQPASTYQPR